MGAGASAYSAQQVFDASPEDLAAEVRGLGEEDYGVLHEAFFCDPGLAEIVGTANGPGKLADAIQGMGEEDYFLAQDIVAEEVEPGGFWEAGEDSYWYEEEDYEDCEFVIYQNLTRDESLFVADCWGIPIAEAAETYDFLTDEFGGDIAVCDFLDEMGVNLDDTENLWFVEEALAWARSEIENGAAPPKPPEDDTGEVDAAVDHILQHIAGTGLSTEDAQALIDSGEVNLSDAQSAALANIDLQAKIQDATEKPPALSATAGHHECRQKCARKVQAIIDRCKAAGEKFTDPDWDATTSEAVVLWVDKKKPGYDNTVAQPTQWKRLSELFDVRELVKNVDFPSGIVQGSCGTCFLLGAMDAFVAQDPRSIKKIFVKYDLEVGVYGVKFCINGEWGFVIVDDYIACNEDGAVLFAGNKDPEEVWAPLLEKAYCKLHTCYEMCDGGFSPEAVFCFFGGVTGHLTIKDQHRENPSSYFNVLKNAKKHGLLLTTGFVATKGTAGSGQGKCGENVLPCGLVDGHAYSLLRVKEAEGNQLVCLRNPWGQGEWTGKWSDQNADGEWTDSMNKACNHKLEEDGTFWMSIEDFVSNSPGAEYARTFGPKWKKVSKYSKFDKAKTMVECIEAYQAEADDELSISVGDEIQITEFWGAWLQGKKGDVEGWLPVKSVKIKDRPIARFDLKCSAASAKGNDTNVKNSKLVIMLMQPNVMFQRKFHKRKEDGLNYKVTEYPPITLVVLGPKKKVLLMRSGADRCVWGEIGVPPKASHVKIYVFSTKPIGQNFTVRAYAKGQDITIVEKPGASFSELPVESLNCEDEVAE